MVLFPPFGLGRFSLRLGFGPAQFSFAMVQAYGLVLGIVYASLQSPANHSRSLLRFDNATAISSLPLIADSAVSST
jgi:hypothetical protein